MKQRKDFSISIAALGLGRERSHADIHVHVGQLEYMLVHVGPEHNVHMYIWCAMIVLKRLSQPSTIHQENARHIQYTHTCIIYMYIHTIYASDAMNTVSGLILDTVNTVNDSLDTVNTVSGLIKKQ